MLDSEQTSTLILVVCSEKLKPVAQGSIMIQEKVQLPHIVISVGYTFVYKGVVMEVTQIVSDAICNGVMCIVVESVEEEKIGTVVQLPSHIVYHCIKSCLW